MIVFLNPHAHDLLATPVSFRLIKRRGVNKYAFLLEAVRSRHDKVDVLVDATLSSLIPEGVFNLLPYPIRRAVLSFELMIWKRLNDLPFVDIHYSAADIEDRGRRALFVFSYKDCAGSFDRRRRQFGAFPLSLVHLSHYMIRTRDKSENIRAIDRAVLVGDSDLASNAYFRHFFPWFRGSVLVLPFVVAPRFAASTPFSERLDKAVATGSFHNLREEVPAGFYRDFVEFWGDDTYHPVRKLIFHRADRLRPYVDSYVSPYREQASARGRLSRLVGHFNVRQRQYFRINIVELYNRYRFAIVGEERSGFPALGAFEAMACGCVLLGQAGTFYEGLGLVDGVHYVAHDGTEEGIVEVIKDLQARPEVAERIALRGQEYVETYMRGDYAYRRLTDFIGRELSGEPGPRRPDESRPRRH